MISLPKLQHTGLAAECVDSNILCYRFSNYPHVPKTTPLPTIYTWDFLKNVFNEFFNLVAHFWSHPRTGRIIQKAQKKLGQIDPKNLRGRPLNVS